MPRRLPRGIYAPMPCFFDESEELDLVAFKKHVKFVSKAGAVPVVSGSMGEAAHLSIEERVQVIKAAREALDEEGLQDVAVVAGVGCASTRETISVAQASAEAGADAVMVVAPSYYSGFLISNGEALVQFFLDVADASPVPVMLYNFPATTGGIDLSALQIESIAKRSDNVCGIKLTCANVGKMTRVHATVSSADFRQVYPRRNGADNFLLINGVIDYMFASMGCGSDGSISGLTLLAPRVCVKLWQLCCDPSKREEAQALQGLVSHADAAIFSAGVPGMKFLLHELHGHSASPRRPLLPMSSATGFSILSSVPLQAVLAMEKELAK